MQKVGSLTLRTRIQVPNVNTIFRLFFVLQSFIIIFLFFNILLSIKASKSPGRSQQLSARSSLLSARSPRDEYVFISKSLQKKIIIFHKNLFYRNFSSKFGMQKRNMMQQRRSPGKWFFFIIFNIQISHCILNIV